MPCKLCKSKPVWKFTNKRQVCRACFTKYFEKKVKTTVGKYNMPIHVVKGRDLKSKILNEILKNLPERKGEISIDSLDNISNKILYIMMYGNSKELAKFLPKNQSLYFLSNKEILLYSKIKKIKGKITENKKLRKINSFIKKIEKKNPDIRHNIVMALLRVEIDTSVSS